MCSSPPRSSTCYGSCSTTAGWCSPATSCSSGSGATRSQAIRARSTCTSASFAGSSVTSARSPPSGASGTRSLTMLRSLRTRLALLFAGTLLLATVIAGAASIRLYQSYNRVQTARDLRSQVIGAADYFSRATFGYAAHGRQAPPAFTVNQLQHICSCRLLWDGNVPIFPSHSQLLQFAGSGTKLDWQRMKPGETRTFQFVPPRDSRTYIGAA